MHRLSAPAPSPWLPTLLLFAGVVLLAWPTLPQASLDDAWYLALAEGTPEQVIKPFSTRILHPYAARALTALTPMSTTQAFVLIALAGLFMLLYTTLSLARSHGLPAGLMPAILFSPLLFSLFAHVFLNDLFHAALLGVFFLALARGRAWAAFGVLFLLFLTRESTLLLALVLAGVGWFRGKRSWLPGLLAAAVAGLAVTRYAGTLGGPNVHHLGDWLYLLAKVPFHFFRNVLGLVPWTNTLAERTDHYPRDPLFAVELPGALRPGDIHAVGIYEIDPALPLVTLGLLLTTFGALPALLLSPLHRRSWRHASPWLLAALLYGLLAFATAPLVGPASLRLLGYGWPAFWIALPVLAHRYLALDRATAAWLLGCHGLLCWLPWLSGRLVPGDAMPWIVTVPLAVLLHGLALHRLRRASGALDA